MLLTIVLVCLLIGILISALTYQVWLYERVRTTPDRRLMDNRGIGDVVGALWVMLLEGVGWGLAILLSPLAVLGDFLAYRRRQSARRPVLLVHGYLHNRTAWVAHGLRLRSDGWTAVYSINLWPPGAPLEQFAGQVGEAVDRIRREMDTDQVDIVGHSMGGVVSRAYLQQGEGHERIAHLVTLGSPHHGTSTAPLGPWDNSLAMSLDSDYLRALNEDPAGLRGVPTTAIYSDQDNIVLPAESAGLPDPAETHVLSGMGHVGLLWSPQVYHLIHRALLAEPESVDSDD